MSRLRLPWTTRALRLVVGSPIFLTFGRWVIRQLDSVVVQQLKPDQGLPLERLDATTALLLNYEEGSRGYRAQAGFWFNAPVRIEYRPGSLVAQVNERVVEVAYAMSSIGGLAVPSRVLDFGANESTIALSLASLGHMVTALDLRPYPLQHPNLTAVTGRIEEWAGPERALDAILCISTLEHVGLGAYGEDATDDTTSDHEILGRLGGWLAPGGQLIFTAPYGVWGVDEFQRTYDREHLDRLFSGWDVTDLRFCRRSSPLQWDHLGPAAPEPWPAGVSGVVLLRATPSPGR